MNDSLPDWCSATLHRTSDLDPSASRELQRSARGGDLTRVVHGVYVDTAFWSAADSRAQHGLRVRALLPSLPSGVCISHCSAAALLGWPRLDPWPTRVHVTDPSADRDVHRRDVVIHHAPHPVVGPSGHSFEAVPLIDAAHTAASLAADSSFANGLVMVDAALRLGHTTAERISAQLPAPGRRGSVRAASTLRCASSLRESVGESYTAARMIEIGAPMFEEQHGFRSADGRVDRVDFWLPELGVVVEFDGRQKYEDPALRHGRSGHDVLWEEKRREDRIRARPEVRGFIRVTWWHLVDPDRLRALFREHGVPLVSARAGVMA